MNGTTFDKLRFFERLIEVDVPKEQAEVFAHECSTILNTHVATKGDVEVVKVAAKTDTELLRKDLESSESRLWVKVLLAMIALTGVIIGAQVLTITILMQYSG